MTVRLWENSFKEATTGRLKTVLSNSKPASLVYRYFLCFTF